MYPLRLTGWYMFRPSANQSEGLEGYVKKRHILLER